ncbi:MAG: hypothetical protein A2455_02565 [Ignavibacteria bacterium RIFOXYC2_FULL_35_16]|nr:MAG: hypothetical protein A2058_00945 [Ignavibacteria bacterium GWA2_36_19]OGU53962.1 MAG: hypothetical protein A2006_05895 [Ignavibacteria bacterium GWC2_35_8]OGU60858.1 MAG: hypothetical protein A2X60_15385 [Ignavibacteria bacterium GWF2_35_20]OGU92066.1 MAG: hypothetical protein A3K31_12685 [Ignavibacteria bacterium RIFOXYA12_FULL_35_25]OGU95715.1 MAG: hypothetical protein A2347_01560 [Ignavibacteria bacterium RIFOXYB12_FULL_35_14]OGU98838.1 MAG: hypothetical protein A2455_02565 [Ignavib
MADQETKKEDPAQPQKLEDWFKNLVDKLRPYIKQLWEVRKKLMIFNGAVAVLVLLYLYLIARPYFESTVTILPEFGSKSTTLAGLSQLATLVGVRPAEGAPAEIYQNLILSEIVLEDVIYSKYKTKKLKDLVNLIEYFSPEKDDSLLGKNERQIFLGVYRNLTGNAIRTNVDRLTKILTITVTMPESQLSADVANKVTESLDKYIRTKRKSFASEQKFYIEKRIEELSDSLTMAENKLKNFSEQNRMIQQSPQLLLERGRLMRNVEILNAVYIELNKQLEVTKIDEIRETPVVNVKEWAKDPIYKAGPARVSNFIKILFLSILLSSVYFLFKDSFIKYLKMLAGK